MSLNMRGVEECTRWFWNVPRCPSWLLAKEHAMNWPTWGKCTAPAGGPAIAEAENASRTLGTCPPAVQPRRFARALASKADGIPGYGMASSWAASPALKP